MESLGSQAVKSQLDIGKGKRKVNRKHQTLDFTEPLLSHLSFTVG